MQLKGIVEFPSSILACRDNDDSLSRFCDVSIRSSRTGLIVSTYEFGDKFLSSANTPRVYFDTVVDEHQEEAFVIPRLSR